MHKQVASLIGVIVLLALLTTGALVPLDQLDAFFWVLKWLMPTAWGIDALRNVLLDGASWGQLWQDFTWIGLAVQNTGFTLLGIVVFEWGFHRAQQQGTLGTY